MSTLTLATVLFGCGGGGGEYYPPSIALNEYGIEKSAFDKEIVSEEQRIYFADHEPNSANNRFIEGDKYYYFDNFEFQGKEYSIGIPLANWVSIIDEEGRIVAKLDTPRYTRSAVAVELQDPDMGTFLAILIDQQSTSHSSTLYILNSSFKPIYKEHLLGAKWIAKEDTPRGDVLLVSSEEKWCPDGETVRIEGDWRYDIFATREKHTKTN